MMLSRVRFRWAGGFEGCDGEATRKQGPAPRIQALNPASEVAFVRVGPRYGGRLRLTNRQLGNRIVVGCRSRDSGSSGRGVAFRDFARQRKL